jgi:hypothetical protein
MLQTKELHYDVVGHPRCEFKFSVIFPFHPGSNGMGPQVMSAYNIRLNMGAA